MCVGEIEIVMEALWVNIDTDDHVVSDCDGVGSDREVMRQEGKLLDYSAFARKKKNITGQEKRR